MGDVGVILAQGRVVIDGLAGKRDVCPLIENLARFKAAAGRACNGREAFGSLKKNLFNRGMWCLYHRVVVDYSDGCSDCSGKEC